MMGGALGLAVLASLAAARTSDLARTGHDALAALNGGYQVAFIAGAVFAALAAGVAAVFLRGQLPQPGQSGEAAVDELAVPMAEPEYQPAV
jgi:hypothetical protein